MTFAPLDAFGGVIANGATVKGSGLRNAKMARLGGEAWSEICGAN
jgi:hypothetical protein